MITQNESLSLPEFEDRLWEELSQLHGSDTGSEEPEQRSPRRRYLVAAAAVALAGLGAGVAAVVAADGPTTEGVMTTPTDEDIPDTEQATEAPAGADAIFYQRREDANGSVIHMWTDEQTGEQRQLVVDPSGKPVAETAGMMVWSSDGSTTGQGVTIDHITGQYWQRGSITFPPELSGEQPESWREAARIRNYVTQGSYWEDGLEVVDGQELLRILHTNLADLPEPLPDSAGVRWVDPETYRPVKRVTRTGEFTYKFLARTPENLKLLEPEIRDGFAEVEPPDPMNGLDDTEGLLILNRLSGDYETYEDGLLEVHT